MSTKKKNKTKQSWTKIKLKKCILYYIKSNIIGAKHVSNEVKNASL